MTGGPTADRAAVASVTDSLVLLVRSFMKTRAQHIAETGELEWAAQLTLKCLAASGPVRAGALAGQLRSDPSTVSRQVAALVKEGLVERQADPEDGRASLLVLTDAAQQLVARHHQQRIDYFARMLAGWSEDDLGQFSALLARFAHDYEVAHAAWESEHAERGRVSAEGNTL